jgi:hypothetical protein
MDLLDDVARRQSGGFGTLDPAIEECRLRKRTIGIGRDKLRSTIPLQNSQRGKPKRGYMARTEVKVKIKKPTDEVIAKERVGQGRPAEKGPFRLQVDRQTKGSFATFEEAAAAGSVIKKAYPVVQASVYDTTTLTNKIIEPAA